MTTSSLDPRRLNTAAAPETLFFDVQPGAEGGNWTLGVDAPISVGRAERPTLFGGVALGGALQAAERACASRTVWATAHFLNRAGLGDSVQYVVEPLVRGRRVQQVRVTGHVGDTPILTVAATLGLGEGGESVTWRQPPLSVDPEDCPPRPHWRSQRYGLHDRLEVRRLPQQDGKSPNLTLWVRPREPVALDVGLLAVIGDLLPAVFWQAAPQFQGGSSLDNTIRLHALRSGRSDWMLCHAQASGIRSDVGHATMSIFDRQGRLLAVCSQSLLLRPAPDATPYAASALSDVPTVKDPSCRHR